MPEIKCPHCQKMFNVEESDYASLLSQVKNDEFEKELHSRLEALEKAHKAEAESDLTRLEAEKDKIINDLKNQLSNINQNKDNEKALALSNKDQKIAELEAKLESKEKEVLAQAELNLKNKDNEIDNLKNQLALQKQEVESKVKDAVSAQALELQRLQSEADNAKKEKIISEKELKERYEALLKFKDEEIERYKDFRVGDSTKDIGESLEQYCHDAFDEIRAVAYPNAYFEKDNTTVEGTKGDFIFRDYTDDDKENEVVSIMFEMKNQKEDGDTKNESHFKKLDSDRNKKKCEYAVLVSTLEPDSKLYNAGIVDMSHKYEKMFVVRPQFFLTIIGLIKNMAKTRFEYKQQVIQYQRENIDVTNFENQIKSIAQKINDDYEYASKQYEQVDKICDNIIKQVNDFREAFRLGQSWIGKAQNQLPNLEVRKLTKNNPTMKEAFEKNKK